MSGSSDLRTAAVLASLAQAEQRARMGGGRSKQKTKKLKGVRRPAKAGAANQGCGTGAGGFAAGNQCALEDGVPKTPLGQGGPLTKPNVGKTRAKAKALRKKAADKQKKKQESQKKEPFSYERKRAKRRAAEKAEKSRLEGIREKLARDKKRQEMLQTIRIRRGNERLAISGQGKSLDQSVQEERQRIADQTKANIEKSPIRGVLEEVRDKYVESAQKEYGGPCKGGLCAPIAGGVAAQFPRGKYRDDLEVSEYFGKGGPGSREHATILVVDHQNKVAYEVDIPEGKYQTRTSSGAAVKKSGVEFGPEDVVVRKLKYDDHAPKTGIYSGKGADVTKNAGETTGDFAARKYERDLKEFHKDIDARFKKVEESLASEKAAYEKLRDESDKLQDIHRAAIQKSMTLKGDRAIQESEAERKQTREKWIEASDAYHSAKLAYDEKLYSAQDAAIHDAMEKFTAAYSKTGRGAEVENHIIKPKKKPFVSNDDSVAFIEDLPDVMKFYSRTASPKFIDAITSQKVSLTTSRGGGSHQGTTIEIGVKESSKSSRVRGSIAKTIAHEYAHAIEDSHPEIMRAAAEDYRKRYAKLVSDQRENFGRGVRTINYPTSRYTGPELEGQTQPIREETPSLMGYTRRYTDFNLYENHNDYPAGHRRASGTEVFSTGVEYLYRSPRLMREAHREQFDFTVLALAGLLE